MYEQASKLRQIMAQKSSSETESRNVRVYCVTSGKGGVGKTNLSINIGIVMQSLGNKVLLIDADLGLANVDVVTGLNPKYNLSHVLSIGKPIQEIMLEGPMGVTILPGASGLSKLADISVSELDMLIDSFKSIANTFDIIIIDTGAGISKNVINFIRSSDEIVVVTTPEPSSITDAYALIKVIQKHAEKIHVVVNKVDNFREAQHTMDRLSAVVSKFLNAEINYLGFILDDKNVYRSNMYQIPFYIKYPNGLASKCIVNIGKKLMFGEQIPIKSKVNVDGWFKRLVSVIKSNAGAV